MTIRLFTEADLPGIRWLHDRTPPAGQVALRPQPWPSMLDSIPAHFAAFWVATEIQRDEEAIVGMAGLQIDHNLMSVPIPPAFIGSEPLARLEAVRVAPERQRRGIGRALTQAALDWARDHSFRRMILDTTPQQEAAVALYESMGFKQLGITAFGRWQIAWLAIDLAPPKE